MRVSALIFIACVVAAVAGFGLYRYTRATAPLDEPLPPGLKFTGLDGKTHPIEEWRGKLLLVNFWATWCSPCMHEIPELVKAQQRYGGRGLQIIGPAVDDADTVRGQLGSLGLDYPVMVGSVDDLTLTMETLGNQVGALPFSLLISPQGHIIGRYLGELNLSDLDSRLARALPQPP